MKLWGSEKTTGKRFGHDVVSPETSVHIRPML